MRRPNEPLRVVHTISYLNTPLACFRNLPGHDAELSPAQMRGLAEALLHAADDCEALAAQTRRYGPARREYPIDHAFGARFGARVLMVPVEPPAAQTQERGPAP